jgi:hypothetical protein
MIHRRQFITLLSGAAINGIPSSVPTRLNI